MTPAQYRTMRQRIGTQEHVAKLLGINRVTLARRETGVLPISTEAILALIMVRMTGDKHVPSQAKSMVAARERRKGK